MVVAQAFDERVSLDQSSLVSCSNSILANSHQNCWASLIEPTLPLKASKLSPASSFYSNPQRRENTLGRSDPRRSGLQQSVELRSLEIANRVFLVNLIALIVNLVLAMLAFYLSYTNNSPSTTAFAADCILDVMSCAIVLWRYYGDLSGVYMHAREQIACIYLGALFEMSALAIVIKALDDIASGADLILETDVQSCELLYLALVATVACAIITNFKCSLFKLLRDNSILLDAINTLISTAFALSIVMSQMLINVDPNFWYLDPVLSLILAVFMAFFGLRVIQQNFDVLKPAFYRSPVADDASLRGIITTVNLCACQDDGFQRSNSNYQANLSLSLDNQSKVPRWQRADYSSIAYAHSSSNQSGLRATQDSLLGRV